MKGIYLEAAGKKPVFRTDLPEPKLIDGGVIVRMLATPVLSYTRDVFSGSLNYIMPTPFVPGNSGIGVVEAVARDVSFLKPGQRVAVDPRMVSHSTSKPDEAESILVGLTGSGTESSARLQQSWRDGTYAEKTLVPAECLTVIDHLSGFASEKLSILTHLAVPYGGLVRGNLRPGQTVIINGATGTFGARAVVVALAMGAAKVVAAGRSEKNLRALAALDLKRVIPVVLAGDEKKDGASLLAAADPVDLYFDMLGRADEPSSVLACLSAVRHRGTAVWMGGVRIPIPIAYAQMMQRELTITGNFMYERSAIRELSALIEAGLLKLDSFPVRAFSLEDFEKAFDAAEAGKTFDTTVIMPTSSI